MSFTASPVTERSLGQKDSDLEESWPQLNKTRSGNLVLKFQMLVKCSHGPIGTECYSIPEA